MTSRPGGPSIPRAERLRKPIELTLSDKALEALGALAEMNGESRSAVVERMVLRAARRHKIAKPSRATP